MDTARYSIKPGTRPAVSLRLPFGKRRTGQRKRARDGDRRRKNYRRFFASVADHQLCGIGKRIPLFTIHHEHPGKDDRHVYQAAFAFCGEQARQIGGDHRHYRGRVDKPDEAERILREAGLTVSLTNVIAIGIPDVPGGFAQAMKALSDAEISVEYMYAFISRDEGRACVILRVEDNTGAVKALQAGTVEILSAEKIYSR